MADGTVTVSRDVTIIPPTPALPSEASVFVPIVSGFIHPLTGSRS